MQPSLLRLAQFGTQREGHHGVGSWVQYPDYERKYQSKFGPNYKIGANLQGLSVPRAMRQGVILGSFGAVAGIFALFFFDGVPRVRKDIMQHIPIIGDHFVKEIPPEDNPF